jgi:hypothetical protein
MYLLAIVTMVWGSATGGDMWTPFGLSAPRATITDEQLAAMSANKLKAQVLTLQSTLAILVSNATKAGLFAGAKVSEVNGHVQTHHACTEPLNIPTELQRILASTNLNTPKLKFCAAKGLHQAAQIQLDYAIVQAELASRVRPPKTDAMELEDVE